MFSDRNENGIIFISVVNISILIFAKKRFLTFRCYNTVVSCFAHIFIVVDLNRLSQHQTMNK